MNNRQQVYRNYSTITLVKQVVFKAKIEWFNDTSGVFEQFSCFWLCYSPDKPAKYDLFSLESIDLEMPFHLIGVYNEVSLLQ